MSYIKHVFLLCSVIVICTYILIKYYCGSEELRNQLHSNIFFNRVTRLMKKHNNTSLGCTATNSNNNIGYLWLWGQYIQFNYLYISTGFLRFDQSFTALKWFALNVFPCNFGDIVPSCWFTIYNQIVSNNMKHLHFCVHLLRWLHWYGMRLLWESLTLHRAVRANPNTLFLIMRSEQMQPIIVSVTSHGMFSAYWFMVAIDASEASNQPLRGWQRWP